MPSEMTCEGCGHHADHCVCPRGTGESLRDQVKRLEARVAELTDAIEWVMADLTIKSASWVYGRPVDESAEKIGEVRSYFLVFRDLGVSPPNVGVPTLLDHLPVLEHKLPDEYHVISYSTLRRICGHTEVPCTVFFLPDNEWYRVEATWERPEGCCWPDGTTRYNNQVWTVRRATTEEIAQAKTDMTTVGVDKPSAV